MTSSENVRSRKMQFFNPKNSISKDRVPWNKGEVIGQKPPLTLKDVWSIRSVLKLGGVCRDLAMFNLAIDSKLRACDLVRLKVSDVAIGLSNKFKGSYKTTENWSPCSV